MTQKLVPVKYQYSGMMKLIDNLGFSFVHQYNLKYLIQSDGLKKVNKINDHIYVETQC